MMHFLMVLGWLNCKKARCLCVIASCKMSICNLQTYLCEANVALGCRLDGSGMGRAVLALNASHAPPQ
jgi:hypothetical protein